MLSYHSFAQPFELDDVRGNDGSFIAFYHCNVFTNHKQRIRVKDKVHFLLLCYCHRQLRVLLHVFFSAEARSNNKDV